MAMNGSYQKNGYGTTEAPISLDVISQAVSSKNGMSWFKKVMVLGVSLVVGLLAGMKLTSHAVNSACFDPKVLPVVKTDENPKSVVVEPVAAEKTIQEIEAQMRADSERKSFLFFVSSLFPFCDNQYLTILCFFPS
jgi:hypothetical protein